MHTLRASAWPQIRPQQKPTSIDIHDEYMNELLLHFSSPFCDFFNVKTRQNEQADTIQRDKPKETIITITKDNGTDALFFCKMTPKNKIL